MPSTFITHLRTRRYRQRSLWTLIAALFLQAVLPISVAAKPWQDTKNNPYQLPLCRSLVANAGDGDGAIAARPRSLLSDRQEQQSDPIGSHCPGCLSTTANACLSGYSIGAPAGAVFTISYAVLQPLILSALVDRLRLPRGPPILV